MISRLGALVAAVFKNLALIGMAILVFEGLLQLASIWLPAVDEKTFPPRPRLIGDPAGGYRGDPAIPEHDALGFRNAIVPDRAEIVALGDSHVYGSNVAREAAWPHLLASALGRSVYNMGLPTYGVADSFDHLDRVVGLRPRLVLLALYFGNDFFDDYRTAKARGRLPEIADEGERGEIERLEAERGIVRHLVDERARTEESARPTRRDGLARRFSLWVKSWSRVFGLLRNLYVAVAHQGSIDAREGLVAPKFEVARAAISPAHRDFVTVHDGPRWKTLLTARYRLQALDDRDLRIRVGARASLKHIARMAARLEAAGIAFAVVLLPTKELAIRPRVRVPEDHGPLGALIASETRWRRKVLNFLAARNIPAIDPLPALGRAEPQPYFANVDSHPNAKGHEVIAATVAAEIEALGLPK